MSSSVDSDDSRTGSPAAIAVVVGPASDDADGVNDKPLPPLLLGRLLRGSPLPLTAAGGGGVVRGVVLVVALGSDMFFSGWYVSFFDGVVEALPT